MLSPTQKPHMPATSKNRVLLFSNLLQHRSIFLGFIESLFQYLHSIRLCVFLQNRKKKKPCHKRIVKSIEVDVYKKVQTFVLVNMCFLFSTDPQRIPVILMKPIFI